MQVIGLGHNAPGLPISSLTSEHYESADPFETLIGSSRWAETARMLVSVHAEHNSTVILKGETGTGRKFLARLIHRCSARRNGPFVVLALGSISDEVARAALFGPENPRTSDLGEKGLAHRLEGGTLYIEEVSRLSPSLMNDVIRLAQRGNFDRNGDRPVRILLGSSVNNGPCQSASKGDASAGLDYEQILIPPLRERPDDIEALAVHFIRERCERAGKEFRKISNEAMKALRAYDWPRNVTELKTLVSQMVQHASPPCIDVTQLPVYLAGPIRAKCLLPDSGVDLENEVRRVEVDLICCALRQSHGLQNKAAQLLRLKPTTLFMKIRRLGIDVAAFR